MQMKITIEITTDELQAFLKLCDSGVFETNESESSKHPDWKFAPRWANYWAMDKSGHSYWYEHEPTKYSITFEKTIQDSKVGRCYRSISYYTGEWQDSLCKRERA